MIEAVIFDLDGTLVHLPIDYEGLFQEFSKIMETTDIRPLTEKISKLDEKIRRRIFEVWEKAELAELEEVTLKDEGFSLYKKFSAKPKAVVTMQGKALLRSVLERLGLSFDFVVTREHCLNRVEQLKIAAEKLRVSLNSVLFIGDTDNDLFAAKKVGCHFLRVKDEDLV